MMFNISIDFRKSTPHNKYYNRWVVTEDGREWAYTYGSKSSAQRAVKRHLERAQNFVCSMCREKLVELGPLCPIAGINCELRRRHPERNHPNLITIACMNTLASSHWYVVNDKGQDCEVVQQAIPVIRKALLDALEVQL